MITKHRKRARLPQAPRTALPELAEFLAPLRVHFTQGPSAETLRQYLTGLLSEHPNKNCDTLTEIVPETNEQQFNHLLTDMVWDENALNRQRIARLQRLPSEGDGVLIFDDTGFEKRGRHSVGVARQYSGTAGKVTNCQVTVNCHYAERTLAWPPWLRGCTCRSSGRQMRHGASRHMSPPQSGFRPKRSLPGRCWMKPRPVECGTRA
jgi:hypothetical protein